MSELYKEFIDFSRPKLDEYFSNTKLFRNQFKYDEESEMYYQKLYLEQRNSDSIKTVSELKKEIEGYKELYKEAASYYLKPRNKMYKGLDVQMGRFLEDLFIEFLKTKLKINAQHADNKNKSYPDIMVLGTDKGILAYIELKYHSAPFLSSKKILDREPYECSTTLDIKKVKKQITLIDSELDRPTFYVHWIDYHDLKGIFYETSEQVKEYLYKNGTQFERKEREGDYCEDKKIGYTGKIYSPLFEMGTFEELVYVLLDFKKNGVPSVDY